jgi:eukaryotic-like serine/threonine-protein kinase
MAAPSTAHDLLDLLHKSRLLEAAELDVYLHDPRRTSSLLRTPRDLAGLLVRAKLLTRFQAENLLKGKWQGFFLGPYKVLEAIAAGSTGVVYLCEHCMMRRRVAVKVLQPVRGRDPESLERFRREARAAAALDHPNIVRGIDVGHEDRIHYLVMEFVNGYSLKQLVRDGGPLSGLRTADYLRQAASGLQHAHDAGLVHRDIKPSNVMVDQHGTVKILDMGLARFFEDDTVVLTQGGVLGSLDYIAPEQVADSHSVDTRADLFSLGATFWFCLTGGPLRQAGFKFLRKPASLRHTEEERQHVPEELWQILRKMTAREPAERYQTALEIVEAVSPLVPPRQTRTTPVSPSADPAAQTVSDLPMSATLPEATTAAARPLPTSDAHASFTVGKVRGFVVQSQSLPWNWAGQLFWLTACLVIAIALAGSVIGSRVLPRDGEIGSGSPDLLSEQAKPHIP